MAPPLALVTGATGFIGSHLTPALLAGGWQVRACGRRARPDGLPATVDYHRVDLAADDALGDLVAGVTHLFHLAGASSSNADQAQMQRDNVVATERLLSAVPAGQLERLVHMSSTSVYGEERALPVPVPEDVEPTPSRGYGKAKWETELVVRSAAAAGLPAAVLRPVSVYGPGNVKLLASVILDVALEAAGGAAALAVPAAPVEQRLVHIDDLVAATVHVARADDAVGGTFNVVDGLYPSSHEVAGLVAGQFALEVDLADDPDCGPAWPERQRLHEAAVAAGMVPAIFLTEQRFRFMRKANRNNRLSTDALAATGFCFTQTDLPGALARTVAWYRRAGWLP